MPAWIAAIATVITLVVMLKRLASYIEFHNDWKIEMDTGKKTITLTGHITTVSPSAYIGGQAWARIGSSKIKLLFKSAVPSPDFPNAFFMTLSTPYIDVVGVPKEAKLDVLIRLSDRSSSRLRRTVPLSIV